MVDVVVNDVLYILFVVMMLYEGVYWIVMKCLERMNVFFIEMMFVLLVEL